MTVILVGQDTSQRTNSYTAGYTRIEREYPCDGTGFIHTVNFRVNGSGTVSVGVFRQLNTGIWECVSAQSLGLYQAGAYSVTELALACEIGDCLGIYVDNAVMDHQTTGGNGVSYAVGNWCSQGQIFTAPLNPAHEISLGGSGTVDVPGTIEAEVEAIMSLVRDDYLPAVRTWLRANVGSLNFYDYQMALFAYAALNQGNGGMLYTGPSLQDIKDALGTPYQTTLADQHTAILDSMLAQHTQIEGLIEDVETAIDVAEGNLDAQMTVDHGNIMDAIAAVGGIDQAALDAAVGTVNGHTTNTGNNVNSNVDSKVAGAITDINSNVDAEHVTTRAAIAALNNLSAAAVEALVNAAVGTLTGEIGEAATAILNALAALEPPEIETGYPGPSGVTLGTSVPFTGTGKVLASVAGVGGAMDGVLLTITNVPLSRYTMSAEGMKNYKYLGWVVFQASDGFADEVQWLGPEARAYSPKHLTSPASVIVCAREGAQGTIQPFLRN